MRQTILVVDDEHLIRWSLREGLKSSDFDVLLAESGEEALELIREHSPDVILLDVRLPGMDGTEVLRRLRKENHPAAVIMISANTDIQTAVETIRLGAVDYATKPLDVEDIRIRIKRALDTDRLRSQFEHLRKQQLETTPKIVGKSNVMQRLLRQVQTLTQAATPTVLITGESGTGKDLLARTIHALGPRQETPWMEIHCSAIPETLLESELFGYEKGAFTDARSRKRGLLELGDGGVVFLNEVGDLPLSTQAKLLDVLEKRSFRRLGGTNLIGVNIQFLAATNRDLQALVREGRFREDLYFRLHVIHLELPALRERTEDIPLLIELFLDRFNRQFRKHFGGCDPEALAYLMHYPWPGNVRELQNVLERIVLMEDAPLLLAQYLPREITEAAGSIPRNSRSTGDEIISQILTNGSFSLERAERILIQAALQEARGNQTRAARLLGITRDTLRYRLQKYEIKTVDPVETAQ